MMYNINRFIPISVIALLCFMVLSCKKDQFQNHSQLPKRDASIKLLEVPSFISILDKDTVITVDFELSEALVVDLDLTISYKEGKATYGEDFEISTETIHIPAFTKAGSFDIYILGDDILDGTEDFTITIGSDDDINFNHPKTINIELNDFISEDFLIEFDWYKELIYPIDSLVSTCTHFDMDFYLYDEDFEDTENYTAATANCIETMVVSTSTPGTFYITQFLYYNGFSGLDSITPIPFSASFRRPGKLPMTVGFVQSDADAFNLSFLDYETDGEVNEVEVFKIVITSSGFAVYDLDDNSISSARKAKKQFLPKRINKR